MKGIIIIYMLLSVILGAIGSILLKKGSAKVIFKFSITNFFELIKNYKIILGITLHLIATIFLILSLHLDKLSIIYPLTSLSYIVVCVLSIYFLKEKMNRYKWLGILFILIGVMLLTY